MDFQLLDQSELVEHFLHQRQHLIGLPLPHVELRGLQRLLGLRRQDVLVVGGDVPLLTKHGLPGGARTVEMLWHCDGGPQSRRRTRYLSTEVQFSPVIVEGV